MRGLSGILILLTLSFCKQQEAKQGVFQLPLIVQPSAIDTIEYFIAHNISENYPRYIGKFKFGDTLKLTIDDRELRNNTNDSSLPSDFISEITSKVAWKKDTIKYGYDAFEENQPKEYFTLFTDSMRSDGLELFTDYKTSIAQVDFYMKKLVKLNGHYYYPVHVVNQTPSTKMLYGKDSYISAIHEAMDSAGRWRPIESTPIYDIDSFGEWGLKIHPEEFFTFLMPKYDGNFKTRLRVRLKVGDMIYVSKPFDGAINKGQFSFASPAPEKDIEIYMEGMGRYLAVINSYYGKQLSMNDLLKK